MPIDDEIRQAGRDEERVVWALHSLREGFPNLPVLRPATVGDGIHQAEVERAERLGRELLASGRVSGFVPASGAASRMFAPWRVLFERGERPDLEGLPFPEDADVVDLAALPKGLVPFHRYEDSVRTAVDEHLLEAEQLGLASMHFTVSEGHIPRFEEATAGHEVTLSTQDPSTDLPALTDDGDLVRDERGDLLFRPGGHGALIYNLHRAEGDFLAVKNIDNVVRDEDRERVLRWRRVLAGVLADVVERRDRWLAAARRGETPSAAVDFAERWLGGVHSDGLVATFDRPLRVAGMVRDTGEPGGGPYWVQGADGRESLQIVERIQLRSDVESHQVAMSAATHFNPVELMLCLVDERGERYDLTQFIDHEAGLLGRKPYGSQTIRTVELPGLWNGSMAQWNTLFVEIPPEVFRPVKTVADLAGPGHRSK